MYGYVFECVVWTSRDETAGEGRTCLDWDCRDESLGRSASQIRHCGCPQNLLDANANLHAATRVMSDLHCLFDRAA